MRKIHAPQALCVATVLTITCGAVAVKPPSNLAVPSGLTTEHAITPLDVDVPQARLSWQLDGDRGQVAQRAYQIAVLGQRHGLVRGTDRPVPTRERGDTLVERHAASIATLYFPIQIKVWINVYPYGGSPSALAQTIFDVEDMFSISVPALTQKIQPGRFHNSTGMPINVYLLTGHMHQRGLRFTVRTSDGTKVYENFDYAHPLQRYFDPPLVISPGDWIDYECQPAGGPTPRSLRSAAHCACGAWS